MMGQRGRHLNLLFSLSFLFLILGFQWSTEASGVGISALPKPPLRKYSPKPQKPLPNCQGWFEKIYSFANRPLVKSEVPSKIVWNTLGTLFWPIKAVGRSLKYSFDFARGREKLPLPSRNGVIKNFVQASLFSLIFLASQASSLPTHYLEAHVPHNLNKAAVVVALNGFPKQDPLHDLMKERFDTRFEEFSNAVYLEPNDDIDAFDSLKQIAKEKGPIQVLEIHDHGTPGAINLGEGEIRTNRYESGALFLRRPPSEALPDNSEAVSYERQEGMTQVTIVRIHDRYRLHDVLAPNAIVIFYGCSTGRGKEGVVFLQYMSDVLSDKPMTLVASNLDVVPNYLDLQLKRLGIQNANLPNTVYTAADVAVASLRLTANIWAKFTEPDQKSLDSYYTLDRIQIYETKND